MDTMKGTMIEGGRFVEPAVTREELEGKVTSKRVRVGFHTVLLNMH
jgi:hypothetical protein